MRRPLLIMAAIAGLSLAGAAAYGRDSESAGPAALPNRPAARSSTPGPKNARSGPSSAANGWWGTLGGLTAVLALVFLTAKVIRKSMPAATQSLPAEVVQVLGRKALDYRNTIHLVRLGSKLLVLGSSQEGLAPLSEITDPVEVDYLAGLCKREPAASLSEGFHQLFRKFQGPPEPEEAPETATNEEASSDESPAEDDSGPDPAVLRLQARLHQPGRKEIDPDNGSREDVG